MRCLKTVSYFWCNNECPRICVRFISPYILALAVDLLVLAPVWWCWLRVCYCLLYKDIFRAPTWYVKGDPTFWTTFSTRVITTFGCSWTRFLFLGPLSPFLPRLTGMSCEIACTSSIQDFRLFLTSYFRYICSFPAFCRHTATTWAHTEMKAKPGKSLQATLRFGNVLITCGFLV